MNTGFTSKHIAEQSKIPIGKIRAWAKKGLFSRYGIRRKRAFYFHNLADSVERALSLLKSDGAAAPTPADVFSEIDSMSSQEIKNLREREELKTLIIKNKKHAEEYVLISESDTRLRNLALEIRTHIEGLPSRMVAELNSPDIEKKVYDFCVKEMENLHGKIKRLAE